MQRPTIPDKDIPTSDPETLIYCFTPWVYKIAYRYCDLLERTAAIDMDDLVQVGCMALLKAQKMYDPAGGANFLTYSFYWIRQAMHRELGISNGRLPAEPVSLDKLLTDDADDSILDTIPDPNILPFDEPIIEQEEHAETAEAVRAAVDRLKNAKQKEVIRRVWLEGQDKQAAADEMHITINYLRTIDLNAREKLYRDTMLQQYAIPYFSAGLSRFRRTWTSVVEAAVIWRDEHLFGNMDPEVST